MTASQDRRSVTALRDLEAKATPAPWTHLSWDAEVHPKGWSRFGGEGEMNEAGEVYKVADGALIAAMRNALPALLDAVEALEWISGPEGFPPVPATVLAREMQARAHKALAALEGVTEA